MQILVADPDRELPELARRIFVKEGFTIIPAHDGETAARLLKESIPDLALLDVSLPRKSGLELLADIRRQAYFPVIMLAAASQEEVALEALEKGADDLILKPIRTRELELRARALLRRSKEWAALQNAAGNLDLGQISLDLRTRQASVGGKKIRLSRTEFALLEFLMRHHDSVMQLSDLASNVWGYTGDHNQNVVKVAVSRLRKKIEPQPGSPRYIVNVPGVGYMFQNKPGLDGGVDLIGQEPGLLMEPEPMASGVFMR